MDKGKGVMGSSGRRWAVDFSDNSTSRDTIDPPGFSRASLDQDDSTLSRQKKDAESNWKSQACFPSLLQFNLVLLLFDNLCIISVIFLYYCFEFIIMFMNDS